MLALHVISTCSSANKELSVALKNIFTSIAACSTPPLLLG